MISCRDKWRVTVKGFKPAPIVAAVSLLSWLFIFPSAAMAFGKNKLGLNDHSWKMVQTVHFDIHYPEGSEDLAVETVRIAEEAYVLLANGLRHELTEVIPVVVYPSHIDFQNNNIIPDMIGEGTGGFTEALKSRVAVPFNGSWGEFRHVLTHELCHAFQFNILFADTSGEMGSPMGFIRVPLWMMEGMAEYFSAGFDETADMVMRDALFNDNWVTLMDLTDLRLGNPYLLYKEGQAFYYFFEKEFGTGAIGELFRDIRDLRNLEEALKTNTGLTIEELNTRWIRFFKKRYYPLAGRKRFDDEDGIRITDHRKTESFMNICPAVSPDGRQVAYITDQDIYSNLVVRNLATGKEQKIRTLVRGNTSSSFEEMHLLSNNLTWSADGGIICFVAQSNSREVIYLVNSRNGDVVRAIVLPFRTVMDPSLSPDGKYVVFAASGGAALDLYLYALETGTLRRLTDDPYADRHPDISPDNSWIVFSSTRNRKPGPEGDDYNLYRMDLASGAVEELTSTPGRELQADISPDGKRILYTSSAGGIYNIRLMDMTERKEQVVTNVLSGVYFPRWFPDGKKCLYVCYQDQGYNLFSRDISPAPADEPVPMDTIRQYPDFRTSYIDYRSIVFDSYRPGLSPDWLVFGLAGTFNYGFIGIAQVGMSDLMGDHSVSLTTNYVRAEGENDFNFQVMYWYLKQRCDFGIGAFRQKNPYMILSLENINDLIHNVNYGTLFMDHYGMYGIVSWPFTRFLRLDTQVTVSRYERDYAAFDSRTDVFANLNQISLSLNYDTVLWGAMVPADGFRGRIEVEQSVNVTGQDYVYTSLGADLRRYFLFNKRYVLALRGVGGKILGPDRDSFKYYLGGYDTLRGHPFMEYAGENMFLLTSEFRFTAIEGIKFGFPLFFGIGQIGGVLFTDCGSAWDHDYSFLDGRRFDDFKMDMGFGFRFVIYPIIILKLDYAWPYYLNSFGKGDLIFSMGFEY